MYNDRKTRIRWTIAGLVLAGLLCDVGSGREWTVGKRKVEATLDRFDGEQVVLKLANGKPLSIPLESLTEADAAHLKTLLELRALAQPPAPPAAAPQGEGPGADVGQIQALRALVSEAQYSRYLQEQSLQQQAALFWRPWFDMWVVQFAGPGGQLFWVVTAARNSDQATFQACRMHPGAEVLWVVKLQRRGT